MTESKQKSLIASTADKCCFITGSFIIFFLLLQALNASKCNRNQYWNSSVHVFHVINRGNTLEVIGKQNQ